MRLFAETIIHMYKRLGIFQFGILLLDKSESYSKNAYHYGKILVFCNKRVCLDESVSYPAVWIIGPGSREYFSTLDQLSTPLVLSLHLQPQHAVYTTIQKVESA